MGRKVSHPVAPVLEKVQRRFAAWRGAGRKGRRIPEELWKAATVAAGELGVSCVSQAIGLDYTTLKHRLDEGDAPRLTTSPTATEPTFVELPMDALVRIPECVIEFEGMRGRFTIRLAGHDRGDVVALAEALSRPVR